MWKPWTKGIEIEVPYRDAILQWQAPFNTKPQRLTQIKNRYAGVLWGNATTAVIYDRWWNNRNAKTYVFDPSKSNSTARILSDRNYQDRYSDPGDFVTQKGKFGETVLTLEGAKAFLLGEGFSEKGQFPFLDQIDLSSLQTNRLYQSAYTDKYEQLYDYNPKTKNLRVRIESKSEYPNYFIRSLGKKKGLEQLTLFPNPFKKLENVGKELISYQREDGLDLSGVLYTPEGFDKENPSPHPMILWAYPREFKDKSTAGAKDQ